MYSDSVPTFRMGDDSEIQAKGIGRIDLEDGYFNNVLFVLDLEANLLLVYQIMRTHKLHWEGGWISVHNFYYFFTFLNNQQLIQ